MFSASVYPKIAQNYCLSFLFINKNDKSFLFIVYVAACSPYGCGSNLLIAGAYNIGVSTRCN